MKSQPSGECAVVGLGLLVMVVRVGVGRSEVGCEIYECNT